MAPRRHWERDHTSSDIADSLRVVAAEGLVSGPGASKLDGLAGWLAGRGPQRAAALARDLLR